MSELSDAREDLQSYWNSLQAQWQTSRQSWRDTVGDHFEREFWDFQEAEMSKLRRTMEELDQSLENASGEPKNLEHLHWLRTPASISFAIASPAS